MKLISVELQKALLEYLSTRPYREVAQAIQALAQLPDAPSADVLETAFAQANRE